jgi:hypothetical protein
VVQQAVRNGVTASGPIVQATGDALPFASASFDAVCEFATLHHAANPSAVVKLALYKTKLWRALNYLRTGGKGYVITEGDGLAYSYSVYDCLGLVHRGADRVILISTTGDAKSRSWFHPLLTSGGILVCALRENREQR